MQEIENDELEFDALAKCSKALSRLDDSTKTRVIQYLLMKFNLIPGNGPVNQVNIVPSGTELLHDVDKSFGIVNDTDTSDSVVVPSVYELITKKYAKSELDILLLIVYKLTLKSTPVLKSSIMDEYKAESIYTRTRSKGLTNSINGLLKKSYITCPTNTTIAVTPDGKRQVKAIVEGRSESRTATKWTKSSKK